MLGAGFLKAAFVNLQIFYDAVIDDHRESFTAQAKTLAVQVKLQAGSLGEVRVAITNHADLAGSGLIGTPGTHDKGVVNGDADDVIDTLGLQFTSLLYKPRQMLG